MTDHYNTLGITESASMDEIKTAYRTLAKKWHPDLNRDNADAEAKFKQINEANDILSDPQKRTQYDQQRKYGGGMPGGSPFGPNAFHFEFGNGSPFDDMINQFFGHNFRQQVAKNKDYQFTLNITLEEAFAGKNLPVNFEVAGQARNIMVNIPAGVQNGTRLRYQGYGDRALGNLPPGDLFVTVNIAEHAVFRRDGPHLHMQLELDSLLAITGTKRDIVVIDGQNISVNVPPGIQHGAIMRVTGNGMPLHNNARQRGDLYIAIHIRIAKDLTAEHMEQIKTIIQQRSGSVE
jgi:curved DNA-binding protein